MRKSASSGKETKTRKETDASDTKKISSSGTTEGSFEVGACCLCHCCLDFSDRAAFFRKDREEDYTDCDDDEVSNKGSIEETRKLDGEKVVDGRGDDNKQISNVTKENEGVNIEYNTEELIEKTHGTSRQSRYSTRNPERLKRGGNQLESDDASKKRTQEYTISASEQHLHDTHDAANPDLKKFPITRERNKVNGFDNNKNAKPAIYDSKDMIEEKNINDEKNNKLINDDDSSYFFRRSDPYLPESLYDPENALVYCDSCDRLFHQKCHFVPLLQVPKGEWHCLICTSKTVYGITKEKQVSPSEAIKNKKGKSSKKVPFKYSADIFKSPPVEEVREQEQKWESDPRVIAAKAELLHEWTTVQSSSTTAHRRVATKLKRLMLQPLQNARSAEMALTTLTSTQQNRQLCYSVDTEKPSQELMTSMVKFYTAKYKLKCQIHNINSIREAAPQYMQWNRLIDWAREHQNAETKDIYATFIQRVLFPFGLKYDRRWEPRTPEFQETLISCLQDEGKKELSGNDSRVPSEIIFHNGSGCGSNRKTPPKPEINSIIKEQNRRDVQKSKSDNNSSGSFSLDKLICSQCISGAASDDNDLILCDGRGCFRAYHMKCVMPAITVDQIEQEESWFCPWCSSVADWLHEIQCHWHGDEWEKKRLGYTAAKGDNESVPSSVKSWEDVNDVFPESDREYEAALQLKAGQNNSETKKLLSQVLGLDDDNMDGGEDDDNVDVDGNFDLYSYEVERKIERKVLKNDTDEIDGSSSSSTHSSQVTLVEMSSVELDIASDELAALSEADSDVESGVCSTGSSDHCDRRRSSRLKKQEETSPSGSIANDPGKMDKNNIIFGKRNRMPVDYRKLNDALFGDWDEGEVAKLDGGEDFEIKASSDKKSRKAVMKNSTQNTKSEATRNRSKKRKPEKDANEDDRQPKRPRTATQLQKNSKSKHRTKEKSEISTIPTSALSAKTGKTLKKTKTPLKSHTKAENKSALALDVTAKQKLKNTKIISQVRRKGSRSSTGKNSSIAGRRGPRDSSLQRDSPIDDKRRQARKRLLRK